MIGIRFGCLYIICCPSAFLQMQLFCFTLAAQSEPAFEPAWLLPHQFRVLWMFPKLAQLCHGSPDWCNWCCPHQVMCLWGVTRHRNLSLLQQPPGLDCSALRRSSLPLHGAEESECSALTAHVWKLQACAVSWEHSEPTMHVWSFWACEIVSDCSRPTPGQQTSCMHSHSRALRLLYSEKGQAAPSQSGAVWALPTKHSHLECPGMSAGHKVLRFFHSREEQEQEQGGAGSSRGIWALTAHAPTWSQVVDTYAVQGTCASRGVTCSSGGDAVTPVSGDTPPCHPCSLHWCGLQPLPKS